MNAYAVLLRPILSTFIQHHICYVQRRGEQVTEIRNRPHYDYSRLRLTKNQGPSESRAPMGVASNLLVRTNTPLTDIDGQGQY